jgi:hypothetical protein
MACGGCTRSIDLSLNIHKNIGSGKHHLQQNRSEYNDTDEGERGCDLIVAKNTINGSSSKDISVSHTTLRRKRRREQS